jgi:hypothetical protein
VSIRLFADSRVVPDWTAAASAGGTVQRKNWFDGLARQQIGAGHRKRVHQPDAKVPRISQTEAHEDRAVGFINSVAEQISRRRRPLGVAYGDHHAPPLTKSIRHTFHRVADLPTFPTIRLPGSAVAPPPIRRHPGIRQHDFLGGGIGDREFAALQVKRERDFFVRQNDDLPGLLRVHRRQQVGRAQEQEAEDSQHPGAA